MSSLLRQLDNRIEELKTGIQTQTNQLSNYLELREIEARKTSKHLFGDVTLIPNAQTVNRAQPVEVLRTTQYIQTPDPEFDWAGNTKIACVAEIMRRSGKRGTNALEVRAMLLRHNIKTSPSFPYVTLAELVKQGKAKKTREGRYLAA